MNEIRKKPYHEDYRVNESIDQKGKKCYTAEYIGQWYAFAPGTDGLRKRLYPMFFAGLVFCILPLFFKSHAGHVPYVIFPQVLALFPLYYLSLGMWMFAKTDSPMKREMAYVMRKRMCWGSGMLLLMCMVTAVGFVANIVVDFESVTAMDHVSGVFVFLAALVSIFIFRNCREIKILPVDIKKEKDEATGTHCQ